MSVILALIELYVVVSLLIFAIIVTIRVVPILFALIIRLALNAIERLSPLKNVS